jgi:hypothetical protein
MFFPPLTSRAKQMPDYAKLVGVALSLECVALLVFVQIYPEWIPTRMGLEDSIVALEGKEMTPELRSAQIQSLARTIEIMGVHDIIQKTIIIVLGMLVGLLYFLRNSNGKGSNAKTTMETLWARQLVIVDGHSRPRAILGFDGAADDNNVGLFVLDKNQRTRGQILVQDKGPAEVILRDHEEIPHMHIYSGNDGDAGFFAYDSDQAAGASLTLDTDHRCGFLIVDNDLSREAPIMTVLPRGTKVFNQATDEAKAPESGQEVDDPVSPKADQSPSSGKKKKNKKKNNNNAEPEAEMKTEAESSSS